MMTRIKSPTIILIAVYLLAIWLGVSSVIFALRHPWMTDTQRLLQLHRAILLQTVEQP